MVEAVTGGAPAVWFRLAVGREDGAEVRHILPMLCRRTGLTKHEIGTIRIGAGETLFAVTPSHAGRVAHAAATGSPHDVAIAPPTARRSSHSAAVSRTPVRVRRRSGRSARRIGASAGDFPRRDQLPEASSGQLRWKRRPSLSVTSTVRSRPSAAVS